MRKINLEVTISLSIRADDDVTVDALIDAIIDDGILSERTGNSFDVEDVEIVKAEVVDSK